MFQSASQWVFGGTSAGDVLGTVVGTGLGVPAAAVAGVTGGALSFLFSGLNPFSAVIGGGTSAYVAGKVFYETGHKIGKTVGLVTAGAAGLMMRSIDPSSNQEQTSTQRPLLLGSTAPALPALTSEMIEYLSELRKLPNSVRIHRALFDQEQVDIQSDMYKKTEKELEAWLKNKLGPLYAPMAAAVYCPVSHYVAEQPILITTNDGTENMISYGQLELHSQQAVVWQYGQYENPYNQERGDVNKLSPGYGTQSLIERMINRLYQFREEQEVAAAPTAEQKQLAQTMAYHRYKAYRELFPSNEQRLHKTLHGSGTTEGFIKFLITQHEVKAIMRHPHHYQDLLTSKALPDLPVCQNSDGVKVDYDLQNTIEQIINLGREWGPEYIKTLSQDKKSTLAI